MKNVCAAVLVALAVGMGSMPAQGQGSDDQKRAAVRALAAEGDAAWDAGDWSKALDRFTRAFELINAPSIGVRVAECLVKQGKLMEAAARYADVANMNVAANAPGVFREAVAKARLEGETLRERIPAIELVIDGAGNEGARVLVDGKEVPRALWGVKVPVNPGTHKIELEDGNRKVFAVVTLAERETRRVALKLEPLPAPANSSPPAAAPATKPDKAPVSKPPPLPQRSSPTPPPPPPEPKRGSTATSQGWLALGVGGAGLLMGGIAGGLAINKRKQLDEAGCMDNKCPSSEADNVDAYNSMRTVSTVGFVAGGLGVAAGLVILLTRPSADPGRSQTSVTPWVGAGNAGVLGRF